MDEQIKMTIQCPNCRKRLHVPIRYAGKKVKCPNCNGRIPIANKLIRDPRQPNLETNDKITIQCPNCSKRLRVPSTSAGRKVNCPGCKRKFELPQLLSTSQQAKKTNKDVGQSQESEEQLLWSLSITGKYVSQAFFMPLMLIAGPIIVYSGGKWMFFSNIPVWALFLSLAIGVVWLVILGTSAIYNKFFYETTYTITTHKTMLSDSEGMELVIPHSQAIKFDCESQFGTLTVNSSSEEIIIPMSRADPITGLDLQEIRTMIIDSFAIGGTKNGDCAKKLGKGG